MRREHVGVTLVVIGLILVLIGAFLAYNAYKTYKPVEGSGSLEEAISSSVMDLVNLAFRLAYIGVIVWAGSVLLRNGIDALKPPAGEGGGKS